MINCPICHKSIELSKQNAACLSGHIFSIKNGVYQITTPEYKFRLEVFLKAFEDWRKNYISKINNNDFKKLPYVKFDKGTWSSRKMDVKLIRHLSLNNKGKALDVGAWNGWLSNKLMDMGFEVTAVDLFTHHLDGLGANEHYNNSWLNLQMDVNSLSILNEKYDLIVINRSLPYFSNLDKTIVDLKSMLTKNGKLIITGINYVKNPHEIIKGLNKANVEFQDKYRLPILFNPSKGYIDKSDLTMLNKHDIKLYPYKALLFKSLLGYFFDKRTFYYYGMFS
jgi:2-polyprenyl-3-methyl-5-hydroxy-6-metoxy-1,4-benzoquinol methylase